MVNLISKQKKKKDNFPKEIVDGSNIRVELPNSHMNSGSLHKEGDNLSTLINLRENSTADKQMRDMIEHSTPPINNTPSLQEKE